MELATVTGSLNVVGIGSIKKLFRLGHATRLGAPKENLKSDQGVVQRLARHFEVADQILVPVLVLVLVLVVAQGIVDHLGIVCVVFGADVRVDRFLGTEIIQLCFGKTTPDLGDIHILGVLVGAVNATHVLEQHVHSAVVVVIILVHNHGFLEETVSESVVGNVLGVKVGESTDVVEDLGLVDLDCGQDQEVLKVALVAEGSGLENNPFEQVDQIVGQVGAHECLSRDRNFVRILRLGDAVLIAWSIKECSDVEEMQEKRV